MRIKDEFRLLWDIQKTSSKNAFLEMWRDPKRRILFVVIGVYILIMFNLFYTLSSDDTIETELHETFVILTALIFITILGIFGLILGSNVFLFKYESDFLLPKPISKRTILMFRFIFRFIIIFALYVILLIYIFIKFYGHSSLSFVNHIQFIYGGFTLSIGLFAFAFYLDNKYARMQDNKLKFFFKIFFNLLLIISMIEYFYIQFNAIMVYDLNYVIELLMLIPPINLFLLLPMSTFYICTTDTYGPLFIIAVLGNGVFAYFSLLKASRYDYTYYEDFNRFAGRIPLDPDSVEIPSKIFWWRKYLIKETPYEYPKINKGAGAFSEIGFLSMVRAETLAIFFMFFGFAMFFSFLNGVEEDIGDYFFIYFAFMFFILIAMVIPVGPNLILRSMRSLPSKGIKVGFYLMLPYFFIFIVGYFTWLGFNYFIGTLDTNQEVLLFSLMAPVLCITLIATGSMSYIIFAHEDKIFNKDISIAGAVCTGIMVFLVLVLNFIIVIYFWTSDDIATAFVTLAVIDLSLIGFLLLGFGWVYDHLGRISKWRRIRVAVVVIVFLIVLSPFAAEYVILNKRFGMYDHDDRPEYQMKIDDRTVIENRTLYFTNELYIAPGGELVLKNCELEFELEFGYDFGILLDEDGSLYMENCTVSRASSFTGLMIELHGKAVIVDSTFSELSARRYIFNTGIEVYSNDVQIINCTIQNNFGNGIYAHSSSLKIIDTTIINCDLNGIDLVNSYAEIINCTIKSNDKSGIYLSYSSPLIKDSTIMANGEYGIVIYPGEPVLENNTIVLNSYGNIFV